MKTINSSITVYLTPALRKALLDKAAEEEISQSDAMRQAFAHWVSDKTLAEMEPPGRRWPKK